MATLVPLRLTHRPVVEGASAEAREEREECTKLPESSELGQKERERERIRGSGEEGEEGVSMEGQGERKGEEEGEVERAPGGESAAESCRDDFEDDPRPKQPLPREEVMDTEEEMPQFPALPISYFPPEAEVEEQGRTLETTPPPSPPHPEPMQLDTQPAAALLIQHTLQQQSHAFPPEGSCQSLPFSQGNGWTFHSFVALCPSTLLSSLPSPQ